MFDGNGTSAPDDVLERRWAVLPGFASRSRACVVRLGAPSSTSTTPTLMGWLRRKKATAIVMRPDGFVYAAADPRNHARQPATGQQPSTIPNGVTA